jgi:periplasmic divalent cation tolerance protein
MNYSLGYITAPTKKEAESIVMELLERQLIACANVLPSVDSFYVWNDAIQKEKELVIILKTREANEDKIIKLVSKMHSYECPCIVFVPLSHGNRDFLEWISANC